MNNNNRSSSRRSGYNKSINTGSDFKPSNSDNSNSKLKKERNY